MRLAAFVLAVSCLQAEMIQSGQEITAAFDTSLTRSVGAMVDPLWDQVYDPIEHSIRLWSSSGSGGMIRLESLDGTAVSEYRPLTQHTATSPGVSTTALLGEILLPSHELSALIHASSTVRVRIITSGSLSVSFTEDAFSYVNPRQILTTGSVSGGRPLFDWQVSEIQQQEQQDESAPQMIYAEALAIPVPEPSALSSVVIGLLWFASRRRSS
jgi:hypothetical protein